jgi:putative ABC transport system permease protein
MNFVDTLRLAFANLGQAKLRTLLTVMGVAIGIGSLSGMVSLGVGLEDQVMGRFTQSGVFDSITVTPMSNAPRRLPFGGRRGGGGAAGRGAAARGTATVDRPAADSVADPTQDAVPDTPRAKLDDDAVARIAALPNVKFVQPMIRVPVQLTYKDYSELVGAAGVAMSSAGEGAFQTFTAGRFFANETDDACMLSLDMAKRISTDDPKTLVGQALALTYAMAPKAGAGPAPTAVEGIPGLVGPSTQIQRVDIHCPIVGIVEHESAPGLMGGGAVSPLMIPLGKARAIEAVQVTSAQSVLRPADSRGYTAVSVKVAGAQHTQEVEARIKDLGYSAFSLNDLVQGAKRAFILFDILLSVIGSIALAVSSLGIVNTMVMSILERTREIGIMKAIGGSDGNIRRIFLIEAAAIGLMGGVAGIILGWTVGRIINFGANWYIESQGGSPGDLFSMPLWLVASAIGFSIFVSLVAGSYPARRAARLDPIKALRHD